MNKPLIFVTLLSLGFSLSSCRDDNTVSMSLLQSEHTKLMLRYYRSLWMLIMSLGDSSLIQIKKINASDYIVNRSREELMEVSSFNRERFIGEMEEINGLLYSIKRSGIATAMIYSTATSNTIIQGSNTEFIEIENCGITSIGGSNVANLTVDSRRCESTSFYSQEEMTLNVSASSKSLFYYYQLSFGDTSNPDKGIVVFRGYEIPERIIHIG